MFEVGDEVRIRDIAVHKNFIASGNAAGRTAVIVEKIETLYGITLPSDEGKLGTLWANETNLAPLPSFPLDEDGYPLPPAV